MLNQHGNDFIKILNNIKPSKNAYEVFSDWLVMAAAGLYSWKGDKAVEEEYLEIAKQYTREELEKHTQLLAIVVVALEEKYQDFLGEVFTTIKLANKQKGQFFTPYHVSEFMAKAIIGGNELPAGRVCKISDPCCGAGGLLIAGAQVMKERGFNYQRNAFFVAQDIDARCARMAYIQLSLLAMPAIIICGNSLTFETYWQRETIGYHMAGMEYRLMAEEMRKLIENPEPQETEIQEEKTETKIIALPPAQEYTQGELFVMEEVI